MKYFILFSFIISSISFASINCNKHPLYCAIKKLKPNIDTNFAMELSNEIHYQVTNYNQTNFYKIDKFRVIAIAMQESSIKINAKRKKSFQKIIINNVCDKYEHCISLIEQVEEVTDVGLFQFHMNEIKKRKLDFVKLQTNIKYNVEQHILLHSEKLRMCSRLYPNTAWACWNSSTCDFDQMEQCSILNSESKCRKKYCPHLEYVEKVNRWYFKIK